MCIRDSLVSVRIEIPIVSDDICSHQCPVRGRGILGVMSHFDSIETKLSMMVEIDARNIFPKFGSDKLISRFAPTRTKKFS